MRWKFPVLFLVLVIGISPSLPGRAEEWKTHTIAQLTLELPEGWFRVFGERPGDPGGFIRPLWEGEPPEGEQIFQSADILVVLSGEYAAGPIEELKQSGTPFTEEPITIGGVTTSLYRAEFMGKEAFMVFLEGSKLGFGLFLKKGSPEARRILESITIGAFPYPLRRLLGQEVLDSPQGVACDLEGRVYVANHSRHQVVVFGADGTLLFTFGEEGMEPGKLFYPAGIALDPEGYIYVTDSMNRIQKFDRKGNFLGVFGKAELQNPKGIAVDREGNVYVVEVGASRVTKLDREGKVLYSFGDGELTLQDLVFTGIAIGKDGEVLVSDPGSHRVAVFDPSGKFLRSIERVPRVRGISLQTDFTKERPYFTPAGIAVDHRGDIYVADNHSGFLLHFDAGGNLQEAWGTLEDHQFPFPVRTIGTIAGVACSPGMIYAAREVTPYALFGFANPSPVPFLVSEIRALPLETPPPSPGTLVAEETPPMPSPSPSPGIVLPGETSPVPSLPPGTALAGEASQPPSPYPKSLLRRRHHKNHQHSLPPLRKALCLRQFPLLISCQEPLSQKHHRHPRKLWWPQSPPQKLWKNPFPQPLPRKPNPRNLRFALSRSQQSLKPENPCGFRPSFLPHHRIQSAMYGTSGTEPSPSQATVLPWNTALSGQGSSPSP